PRLAALPPRFPGREARLRPARLRSLDGARVGAAADLLLLHAAAQSQRGAHARQHQLRVGHERHRGADLDAARRLADWPDDLPAGRALRARAFPAGAVRAEAGAQLVTA